MVKRAPGVREAIKAAGSIRRLAAMLKISHTAILGWKNVPYERILEIESATGVPRERLRPELYRDARSH